MLTGQTLPPGSVDTPEEVKQPHHRIHSPISIKRKKRHQKGKWLGKACNLVEIKPKSRIHRITSVTEPGGGAQSGQGIPTVGCTM